MNPLDTATALAAPVGALGGKFMLDPATFARGAEIGFPPGFEYYALGRLGVLGDVDPVVVAASAVMFEPGLVANLWTKGRSFGEPAATAAHYATSCQAWGREHLTGQPGLDRLAELLEQVVAAAPTAGLPLFAGWKAMPRPADAAGATYQLLHTLREYRFEVHCIAILAEGLAPLEAVLAGPGGEANAKMFGWTVPYPDITDEIRARRAAAEDRTNALCAVAYESLTDAERTELVDLVTNLRAHVIE